MNQQTKIREGFVGEEPPAEEQPLPKPKALAVSPWPVKVQLLHKPIRVNGELVKELSFREPTGGDINRYGNPVHVDYSGEARVEVSAMRHMMAALAGVLPPDIDTLDPRDWNSCAYRLRGFFLPDPTAW